MSKTAPWSEMQRPCCQILVQMELGVTGTCDVYGCLMAFCTSAPGGWDLTFHTRAGLAVFPPPTLSLLQSTHVPFFFSGAEPSAAHILHQDGHLESFRKSNWFPVPNPIFILENVNCMCPNYPIRSCPYFLLSIPRKSLSIFLPWGWWC